MSIHHHIKRHVPGFNCLLYIYRYGGKNTQTSSSLSPSGWRRREKHTLPARRHPHQFNKYFRDWNGFSCDNKYTRTRTPPHRMSSNWQAGSSSQESVLALHAAGNAAFFTAGAALDMTSPTIKRLVRKRCSCPPLVVFPSEAVAEAYGDMGGRPTAAHRAEVTSCSCDSRSSNLIGQRPETRVNRSER